jgi:hypothetical protein
LTARKLRLFACACVRRAWHLLPDARSRRAVEQAEWHADGLVGREELEEARRQAAEAADDGTRAGWLAASAATWTCFRREVDDGEAEVTDARGAASQASDLASRAVAAEARLRGDVALWGQALQAERAAQAALLRDVAGDPFRPLPVIESSVLAQAGGTALKVASAIYDANDLRQLPVLADALEDAGLGDTELVSHLRGAGPHARGCFALDAVLAKK